MEKDSDVIMGDKSAPHPLFFDVSYVVISPPQLPYDDPGFTDLLAELELNGARHVCLDPETNRIRNMDEITHIISRTADFPDYDTALERLKHVVKPTWIQISLSKRKQQNPRQYSPDPALFMNDVTVYCSGIPDGDKEAIYGAVLALGGLCSENFTKLVTHLVVLSIDDPVCEIAQRKGIPCKIVLPHWFDDCLRLRRRISEQPYLLPDPEILRNNHDGPPTPRNPRSINSAMSSTPSGGIFSSPSLSLTEKEITVFNQVKVKLSNDLDISQTTRSAIEDIIKRSGGSVTEDIEETDCLICQYRENNDFIKFWKRHEGKHVGNLSWLFHLIVHNKYSNPLNKLLHFPTPRNRIPGFEGFKICISNYTGNARIYVENLARLTGAVFTKTMAQENTHLIAAHTESEKYDAAQEWNINVVNHVWLEDSYAKMKVQSLTSKSYTHFPSRTNLGEVVGQTPIDRDVIQKWIDATYRVKEHQEKRKSGASNNAPSAINERVVMNGADDTSVAIRKRSRPASTSVVTPATRRTADGKENGLPISPMTSGSRNAKAKALSKLHDAAADIALYDKERKRVGGVIHGRDRNRTSSGSVESAVESKKSSPKRTHDETEDTEEDELAGPPGKKAKNGRKMAKIRVMVSMYDRWQDRPELQTGDKVRYIYSIFMIYSKQYIRTSFETSEYS
jgi:twin BRCT domain